METEGINNEKEVVKIRLTYSAKTLKMLQYLARIKSSCAVVWETASTLVVWLRSLLRGATTPRIAGAGAPTKPNEFVPRIWKLDVAKQILKVVVGGKESALKSRSVPNNRLAITFKIENAFTTMSLDVHDKYVSQIRELLKMAPYLEEQDRIKKILEKEKNIFVQKYGDNLPFQKYILTVSFKFALKRFLGDYLNSNLTEEEFSQLSLKAGDNITLLWLESKKGTVNSDSQRALFDILQTLFPTLDVEDKIENPLGIILPSFETLWRVMYRLCVTVQCSAQAALYLEVFRQFGEDPSDQSFKKVINGVSVEYIIKEILFINPPTGTIYRTDENNNIIGVDVKMLHMENVDIKEFFPQRWANGKEIPFFTFGHSSMSCPAKRFAPVALGLMGAAIFEIFQDYAWDVDLNKFGSSDKNDRDKYFEFEIKKMK